MATTIRELLVALGVDADTAEVSEFDAAIDGAKATMGVAVKAAAALAAGVAAVTGAFAYVVNSARAGGDEIDKNSASMAAGAREYQVLAFAAAQGGAEINVLRAGMTQMNAKVQAATKAGNDYVELLDGTRMAVKGANGETLTQLELLANVADAVKAAATEEEKLTIATSLLGMEGGARLIPMLENGSAGLASMEKRAQSLGIIMSDELVKASADLTDRMGEVSGVVSGLRNSIAEKLLPVVNDLLTRFLDWYEANGDLVRQNLEEWAAGFAAGIDRIADAIAGVGKNESVMSDLLTVLGALAFSIDMVLAGVNVLANAAAWGIMSGAFEALKIAIIAVNIAAHLALWPILMPIDLLIAGIVGMIAVVDDLISYFRGGESAIGTFIERNRDANTVLGVVARKVEQLIEIGKAFYDLMSALGTLVSQVFGEHITPYIDIASASLSRLGEIAVGVINSLAPLFDLVLGGSSLGGLLGSLQGMTALVQAQTDGASLAPTSTANNSTSLAQSNQVQVTVNGDADGQSIADKVMDALYQSNRDAQAALAGAEV